MNFSRREQKGQAPVTYDVVELRREANGYCLIANPCRNGTLGGPVYVFGTVAALNRWLREHMPQP